MNDHDDDFDPTGSIGELATFLTASGSASASGLVSKPITIRLSGSSVLILEAAAKHFERPPAGLLRMVAEAGLNELAAKLDAKGIDVRGGFKVSADDQGRMALDGEWDSEKETAL